VIFIHGYITDSVVFLRLRAIYKFTLQLLKTINNY